MEGPPFGQQSLSQKNSFFPHPVFLSYVRGWRSIKGDGEATAKSASKGETKRKEVMARIVSTGVVQVGYKCFEEQRRYAFMLKEWQR